MKFTIPAFSIALVLSTLCSIQAADFRPITAFAHNMVSDNPGGDPELAGGSGVGFNAAEPHNKTGGANNWYTNAPGGFPSDYISVHAGPEYIWFDFGSDVPLNEISYWGYSTGNANGMRDFNLSFASDAGGGAAGLGDESYGTTITLNPSFTALQEDTLRQSFGFTQVDARYVRVEATSTYFGQPGAGAGGDRLGIGEIAFADTEVPGEANIIIPDSVMPTLVYDATTDFTISVFNSGGQELTISGTNLIGTNATAFSVLGAPAIIDPTSSADITLQFDPAGLGGPISATLQITSNDPDTPTAEVLINSSLPALGPDISVPAGLALTAAGLAETLVIPVENLGRAQLDIASTNIIGPNKANFVVTILPANIAALASDSIEIAFDPAGLSTGAISATLQILSNDPDTPTAEIFLSGGIAESFYPISSVTSATEPVGSDFYLATNLIQGPGTGFDTLWPHDALGFAQSFAWVTDAPNGGAGDYFDPVPAVRPNMVFDLGSDVGLGEISFWGYSDDNANGANLFSLRFATSADGPTGFGTSISYNPEFAPIQDQTQRQSFEFDQGVFARYVEWVPLDNFFGINPPGGDRVGAGEIAFAVRAVDNEITILSIARGAGDVTLTFKSRDGLSYAIFRSPDLGETGWQELDDSFASQGDETDFVDFNVPEGIQRMFYQVRNAGE